MSLWRDKMAELKDLVIANGWTETQIANAGPAAIINALGITQDQYNTYLAPRIEKIKSQAIGYLQEHIRQTTLQAVIDKMTPEEKQFFKDVDMHWLNEQIQNRISA